MKLFILILVILSLPCAAVAQEARGTILGTVTDASGATPLYTFNLPGVYPVCVQVSDGTGGTSVACVAVDIAAPPRQRPVCDVVMPQIVASNTGGVMTFTLDGSRSYDVNSEPLTYHWTTDGGGSIAVRPVRGQETEDIRNLAPMRVWRFELDRENMLYHNPKLEELTWILEGETKVRSKKFK